MKKNKLFKKVRKMCKAIVDTHEEKRYGKPDYKFKDTTNSHMNRVMEHDRIHREQMLRNVAEQNRIFMDNVNQINMQNQQMMNNMFMNNF